MFLNVVEKLVVVRRLGDKPSDVERVVEHRTVEQHFTTVMKPKFERARRDELSRRPDCLEARRLGCGRTSLIHHSQQSPAWR